MRTRVHAFLFAGLTLSLAAPVEATVVARLSVAGASAVAPTVAEFGFGSHPVGYIDPLILTFCFQDAAAPEGSCNRSGEIRVINNVAPPFYFTSVFRQNLTSGKVTPAKLPLKLAANQRANLLFFFAPGNTGSHEDRFNFEAVPDDPATEPLRFPFDFTGFGQPVGTCSPSSTLCLAGGRFQVRSFWAAPNLTGDVGKPDALTDDTGNFWFFNQENIEVVIKILNGCPVNNRFWVFAGGLTNVQTVVTVTDTQHDVARTYINPLGTPFQPIQDTSAFATCP